MTVKIADIFTAIQCRVESLTWQGVELVVREVDASASLIQEHEAEKLAKDGGALPEDELYWRILVRSVFVKETNKPLFEDADIAELRKASRNKLGPLVGAVDRVNGLRGDDNAKNSPAVQA